jgi:hypothetical protein
MSYLPKRPTGSTAEALFDQWVYDQLTRRLKLNGSPTVKLRKTAQGITIEAVPQLGGGAMATLPVQFFHFKTMFANYFIATDGTRIAKDYKLRNSTVQETTSEGTVYQMAYQGAGTGAIAYIARIKTGGNIPSPGEYQRISPIYSTGSRDEILALQIATTVITESADTGVAVGTPVGWIELKPARQWLRKIDQSGP